MKRLSLGGRIAILAALASCMGHAPKEAQDILEGPRPTPPPDPKDPKATTRMQEKTAADIDVEVPQAAPTMLRTDHAMHAIVKAKRPELNRQQRRQLAHRMQAVATKSVGVDAVVKRALQCDPVHTRGYKDENNCMGVNPGQLGLCLPSGRQVLRLQSNGAR